MLVLVLSLTAGSAAKAQTAFNYAGYPLSTLQAIGDRTRDAGSAHEGGYEFFKDKYKLKVRLGGHPGSIAGNTMKLLQFHAKTMNVLKQEYLKIFTHELEIEQGGYVFTLVFQEQLVPFLQKEVRPGDEVYLYTLLVIYDCTTRKTMLLVNEFETMNR